MSADRICNKKRPAKILLIEDNHGDVLLIQRAFKAAKNINEVYAVSSGEEALKWLKEAEDDLPDLVLLDMNLSQMNGQGVVGFIKSDIRFCHIPVIMLSSSRAESDVVRSYRLHANAYITKPSDLDGFRDMVHKLEQFWFALAILPDAEDAQEIRQIV